MQVVLAKRTGFCFGVRRAVSFAQGSLKDNKAVYSLGSIIHNRQVVDELAKKGLRVIKDIKSVKHGTVVISSHGISPTVKKAIAKKGLKIIDTTCPFVLNAQRIAKTLGDDGYIVIIVGDVKHPEVKALVDFVSKRVCVVKDRKEARRLKLRDDEKISIIAQTTQSVTNFRDVVKEILKKHPRNIKIINTICRDVQERQDAAKKLAESVDIMLVVGGRDSANTRRLLDVCRSILNNSHLIETEKGLKARWFKNVSRVGITSGASTPAWIVKRVVDKIRSLERSYSSRSRDEIYT